MVLQRAPQQAAIYGEADRGSEVRITLISEADLHNHHEVSHVDTFANDQGHYMALLPPQPAGGPYVVSNYTYIQTKGNELLSH